MAIRSSRVLLGAAALTLLAGPPAAAADPEQPHSLATADVLPADQLSGPGYSLAPEVFADGFAQHFTVRTPSFGELEASSDYQLGVRLLEVRALAVLEEMGTSETFAKAIAKAGAAPIVLAKNLATRPVETITAVPKGLHKGAKKAVTWVAGDRRQRAETESGATKEAIGFSRRKRAFAARLNVAPYTSNLAVQDQLDRIASASFSGGITLSVAFAAVGEVHSREVWLTGVASPRAREELAAVDLVLLEEAGERLEPQAMNAAAESAAP